MSIILSINQLKCSWNDIEAIEMTLKWHTYIKSYFWIFSKKLSNFEFSWKKKSYYWFVSKNKIFWNGRHCSNFTRYIMFKLWTVSFLGCDAKRNLILKIWYTIVHFLNLFSLPPFFFLVIRKLAVLITSLHVDRHYKISGPSNVQFLHFTRVSTFNFSGHNFVIFCYLLNCF